MSKRLPADWGEIKRLFIYEGWKATKLAQLYDLAEKTISNKACLEGWHTERDKFQNSLIRETIVDRQKITDTLLDIQKKALVKILESIETNTAPKEFYLEAMKQAGKSLSQGQSMEGQGIEFINLPGIDVNSL